MVPGHRYAGVDALRGVAALLVLVLHAAEIFAPMPGLSGRGAEWHHAAASVDLGRAGVVAFFLISGFVIPATLEGRTGDALRRFWIRRACRLYPAFWLSIPLGFYALWTLHGRSYTAADVVANATMLPMVFGRDMAIGLYWTLETELVFYALCSALFAAGGLRRPGVLIGVQLALLVLALAMKVQPDLRPTVPQWLLMPHSLAVMFAGALCREAFEARERMAIDAHGGRRALAYAVTGLLLGLLPALAQGLGKGAGPGFTLAASYAIGFALFVVTITWVRRPPRVFVWLGTISYSLYLLHPIPLYIVASLLTGVAVPAPIGVGTLVVVVAALAVPLAAASYYAVELPAIRRGRRWTQAAPPDRGAARAS
jgi:peptidoglycan/LPS O-acetylase OafA/YrhL